MVSRLAGTVVAENMDIPDMDDLILDATPAEKKKKKKEKKSKDPKKKSSKKSSGTSKPSSQLELSTGSNDLMAEDLEEMSIPPSLGESIQCSIHSSIPHSSFLNFVAEFCRVNHALSCLLKRPHATGFSAPSELTDSLHACAYLLPLHACAQQTGQNPRTASWGLSVRAGEAAAP